MAENKLKAGRKKMPLNEVFDKAEEWAENKEPHKVEQLIKVSVQLPKSVHFKFKVYCMENSISMNDKLLELVRVLNK